MINLVYITDNKVHISVLLEICTPSGSTTTHYNNIVYTLSNVPIRTKYLFFKLTYVGNGIF